MQRPNEKPPVVPALSLSAQLASLHHRYPILTLLPRAHTLKLQGESVPSKTEQTTSGSTSHSATADEPSQSSILVESVFKPAYDSLALSTRVNEGWGWSLRSPRAEERREDSLLLPCAVQLVNARIDPLDMSAPRVSNDETLALFVHRMSYDCAFALLATALDSCRAPLASSEKQVNWLTCL